MEPSGPVTPPVEPAGCSVLPSSGDPGELDPASCAPAVVATAAGVLDSLEPSRFASSGLPPVLVSGLLASSGEDVDDPSWVDPCCSAPAGGTSVLTEDEDASVEDPLGDSVDAEPPPTSCEPSGAEDEETCSSGAGLLLSAPSAGWAEEVSSGGGDDAFSTPAGEEDSCDALSVDDDGDNAIEDSDSRVEDSLVDPLSGGLVIRVTVSPPTPWVTSDPKLFQFTSLLLVYRPVIIQYCKHNMLKMHQMANKIMEGNIQYTEARFL